ncbi:uncharacterized protein V2V93DRAFT_372085 [Kockiozyma suomiensis]|uniref:uncharacterized protein n=1 Tax=Kockiozyma suomiensis TaxID=1337062 RepID=UPI0033432AFB
MTSYQTKTAPTNYNDALPIHFASAQPSSLGGGKSSGSLHRQLLNVQQQQQQTEVLVIPPATRGAVFDSIEPSESDKFISVEQTSLDLEQLLALPNAIPTREATHYCAKLRNSVPSLSQPHLQEFSAIVEIVLKGDKLAARGRLVKFMMVENGVASAWGTALRRIIDGVEISL